MVELKCGASVRSVGISEHKSKRGSLSHSLESFFANFLSTLRGTFKNPELAL